MYIGRNHFVHRTLGCQLSDGLAQSKILIQGDQIELNYSIATLQHFKHQCFINNDWVGGKFPKIIYLLSGKN